MIKALFITLGLGLLVYVGLRFFATKRSGENAQKSGEVLNLLNCSYCGDFVENQPQCPKGICEICDRKCSKVRK